MTVTQTTMEDRLSGLRAWQREAFEEYFRRQPRDFLAVATPGAGKTTFALTLASELLQRHAVRAITIVCPTEHLKKQWAEAAARFGIAIDPDFKNGQGALGRQYIGVAVTYAQVAAHPMLHRNRTEARKTLVIFDEVHHAGDALSWGDAVRESFDPATRRLSLTGTPFRSDINPIPFVDYVQDGAGVRRCSWDYSYGYAPALEDGVVRPVIFMAYSGEMRWRTRAGDELAARLGEPLTQDALSQAWRAALDPKGDWIKKVLQAADRRLTEVRKTHPDAGGLVIASDHENARAYSRILRQITGKGATVVLSDDPTASKKISRFAAGDDRWMVAVRMVSEGVDVPRLMVGVYATSTSTPLFFAQAIGRFVRVRKRGEVASVFLPSVPTLLEYAGEMERERDHVLDKTPSDDEYPEEDLLREANKKKDSPDAGEELPFETMESAAEFDRALYDGLEYGGGAAGSSEEEDFLGLPGLLEPDQVSQLLRKRKADIRASELKAKARRESEPEEESGPTHEVLAELRRELSGLVGAWHHRTGKPHGVIHNELRRACGGPPVAQASPPQIRERIAKLRAWAVGQK
ncbi:MULTISPECIES: DEAD/DEAH box helicase [Nocardiopsis]|uniref:DEAD/DEAH box helicase n=1 Tax=Nocardiopsis alba TaxID=53437 RepID=A0A7K2IVI1_9ACTN|nr:MULTISPECIES: DEAD/DEAH box helicase [Nocardiopsis]MEC3894903.1 DEAD/DEAH box helicase [Nocardiopsis sp. LDBS1602]MYR33972.1 DEAD/DEAH box helicase family protein [Nocardiopsis alba]